MQKITPFLWFDGQAEEAVRLYASIFKNSKVLGELLSSPDPKKSQRVMTAMLAMKKIDLAGLLRAADGEGSA